jgi:hypothetical protein
MYKSFLPVVRPEIGGSLERDLLDKFDETYVIDHLDRLDTENPTISRFIRKFSKSTGDDIGAMFCGIIVYRMLESQAEANRMNEEFGA